MARKSKFMTRLIMGKERSEGYARSTLPTNRWGLFWDVLKGSLSKVFLINILTLLFLIPLVLVLMLRNSYLTVSGANYPFAQGLAMGYPAMPSFNGFAEQITTQANLIYFGIFMPVAAIIASVGISGGAYVIRNLIWTEGTFVAKDFWHGIKVNFWIVVRSVLLYAVVLFLCIFAISSASTAQATGSNVGWLLIISQIASYLLIIFSTIMVLYMITLGVTYELNFRQLFKNALIFTIALFPFNLFFLLLTALPLALLWIGSLFTIIGYILMITLGFAIMLMIWTNYSQWAFDRFINSKMEGGQTKRGIYEKAKVIKSEALQQYKAQMEQSTASSYLDGRPIKPIDDEELQLAELPQMFTRDDLDKLEESRQAIYKDHEEYVKAQMEKMDVPENAETDEKKPKKEPKEVKTAQTNADKMDEIKEKLKKQYGVTDQEIANIEKNKTTSNVAKSTVKQNPKKKKGKNGKKGGKR